MKKKSKITILVIVFVLVIASVTGIICSTYDKEFNEWNSNFNNIQYTVEELRGKDNYKNSSDEEKVELLKSCLEELENNGKINNLKYSNYAFAFDYTPYGKGAILVKETEVEDCWGSSSNFVQPYLLDENIITETISSNKTNVETQNWSFVLGASNVDESISNQIKYMASDYDNAVTNIDYITKSDVSTYMDFSNSKLIYISAHGWYNENDKISIIWTEENPTTANKRKYKKLIQNGSIGIYMDQEDNSRYVILPDFFQNYYNDNELENSIVLFAVCCSYGNNNSENYDFYDSLKKAGATTVVGACNSINQAYSLFFYDKLISCYLSGMSIGDSFEEAQNIIGKDDNEFAKNFPETEPNEADKPGYFLMRGDKEETLKNYDQTNWGQYGITIKDSDTQEPINNVLVELTKENGATHVYKSDSDGFCKFVLPDGEYKCNLSCSEYKDKTIDVKIEKNMITSLQDAVLLEKSFTFENIYYEYIKNKLTLINCDEFPVDEDNTGVFSAIIDDFDDDNVKEMITFSYENVDGGVVALKLYKYLNNEVKLYDTSETIYTSGGGNFMHNMCATLEDNIIKIQYDNYGYGGSSHASDYMSYKVKNNRLVRINNYSLEEFYRYDKYDYTETVSEKKFSNATTFTNAVKSANYDVKAHLHAGYTDSAFNPDTDDYCDNEIFKGNHIFTLINSNNMIKSDKYGFINDNTDLMNNLGITSTIKENSEKNDTNKEVSFDKIKEDLINYYWENNIQTPCIYEFNSDGTVKEYWGTSNESKSSWIYNCTYSYSISDDNLIINVGDYVWNLKYITKSENIDWDEGLTFYDNISDDEYFFYETDFKSPSDGTDGNATYLLKSKLK